jgi:hypothetical protein
VERGFYRAEIAVISYNPGSKGNGFCTRPVCWITGSPGAAFELVRSLQHASGIANSQTKDQASRCNIDQRYEREAGCK